VTPNIVGQARPCLCNVAPDFRQRHDERHIRGPPLGGILMAEMAASPFCREAA
jgi:hypothetical protein